MLEQIKLSEAYKTGYEHGNLNARFNYYSYLLCDDEDRKYYMLGFEHGVNSGIERIEKQEVL